MKLFRQTIAPVLAAFFWGTTFVAQSLGADSLGAFSFCAYRSLIAFFFLFILSILYDWTKKNRLQKKGTYTAPSKESVKKKTKATLFGGLCCGLVLTVASTLQQQGIAETSAGKASFMTTAYVILVPIFGVFLKKKAPVRVWFGAIFALIGLYFLSIQRGEHLTIESGDIWLILCAISFAFQILTVDHFSTNLNGIKLSCIQFGVVTVLCTVGALIFEDVSLTALKDAFLPALYAGIFSSGVAYTLQIVSQKDTDPTVVTVLMSLESVFGVISGAIVLHERLTNREYLGCLFMFIAVLLAQIPIEAFLKKKKENAS